MLFSSLVFLSGFLPAVLLIYYVFLRGRRKAQNVFLLLASLGFYAWGGPGAPVAGSGGRVRQKLHAYSVGRTCGVRAAGHARLDR